MTDTPPLPERLPRLDLHEWQCVRLMRLLSEIVPRNPFWTNKFDEAGIRLADIRTPAELQALPFTTKAEILADQQGSPPYGTNLTFDLGDYCRLHQTSGTTGHPLRWLDTPESWEWMMGCWAQLFRLLGLTRQDRLFFPFSFGPFLGFWAGFEGANRMGNLCLPGGGLSSHSRLNMMLENRATVVCCTPTYALRLAEVAAELKIDLANSPVRAILVAGEPGGNIPATRRRIEEAWGARVFDHWGMTEVGPMGIETAENPGSMAMLETECIVEIIDPQTGVAVPPGTEGELVITNLGRIGSPLIRYRTGDKVKASTHVQQDHSLLTLEGGILGRMDDMLTIRGNNLYPSAMENVIRQFDGVAEYRIEVRAVKAMQHVKIEIEPKVMADADSAQLVRQIADTIKELWHFQADVIPVATGGLPRFEQKGRRFFRVEEGR